MCYICSKPFENEKVRDNCHLTGKYRGAAHKSCNLNYYSKFQSSFQSYFRILVVMIHIFLSRISEKQKVKSTVYLLMKRIIYHSLKQMWFTNLKKKKAKQ